MVSTCVQEEKRLRVIPPTFELPSVPGAELLLWKRNSDKVSCSSELEVGGRLGRSAAFSVGEFWRVRDPVAGPGALPHNYSPVAHHQGVPGAVAFHF